jgi:hypothetical protein
VTLAECRAWALTHNLDLRVALLNPTIAAQRVTAEEARFESLLFADAIDKSATSNHGNKGRFFGDGRVVAMSALPNIQKHFLHDIFRIGAIHAATQNEVPY